MSSRPTVAAAANDTTRGLAHAREPAIDQLPHAGGRDRGDGFGEVGGALDLHCLLIELAQELPQEERVAARDVVQGDGELHERVHGLRWSSRAHECAHFVIVESRQLDRGSPASEALDELGPFRVDLVAERGDDEQAFELRVTNEMTDQLQRRAVGPMDVLEEHHGGLRRE